MSDLMIDGNRGRGSENGSAAPESEHCSQTENSAQGSGRAVRFLAIGLAGLLVLWAAVNLLSGWVPFAVDLPEGREQDAAVANLIAKLFGTLALLLLSADAERQRLRWLAVGFLTLTFGQALTKLIEPVTVGTPDLNAQLYERLTMWTAVTAVFAVGLFLNAPPRLPWWRLLAVFAASISFITAVSLAGGADLLPPLIQGTSSVEEAAASSDGSMPGLTGWHFALTSVPLILALAAMVGALRRSRKGALAGWVVVAAVLLAGSQLHTLAWPPGGGGQVLATTQVLHFAFAVSVGVGGILELRRIAAERTALFAAEQEQARHLRELAVLKADFTAMVAHELGSPLAAIQGYTEMLSTGKVPAERREQVLVAIQNETDALYGLVADVQAAATTEREDFTVHRTPVELDDILEDAASSIRALDGNHPLALKAEVSGRVWADAERVGQVLRNLLSNAIKYSPEGTPIELRARPVAGTHGERVRIEVADRGRGIHPNDLSRIFEKFGRGRDENGEQVAGSGLGLYLSRRILRAHGSELTLKSEPGEGSVFGFELETAR